MDVSSIVDPRYLIDIIDHSQHVENRTNYEKNCQDKTQGKIQYDYN